MNDRQALRAVEEQRDLVIRAFKLAIQGYLQVMSKCDCCPSGDAPSEAKIASEFDDWMRAAEVLRYADQQRPTIDSLFDEVFGHRVGERRPPGNEL